MDKQKVIPLSSRYNILIITFLAAVVAFILGALIIYSQGSNPIEAYKALLRGAFGGVGSIGTTISRTIPLILTGLAVAIAYKSGVFNIGGEGQLLLGGICATVVGVGIPDLSPWLHIPLCIVAALIGGAAWALIPGILKAKRGVNEVITTLMMNYIAIQLLSYLLRGPMRGDPMGVPASAFISQNAEMPIIWQRADVSLAAIITPIIVILMYVLMFKTNLGYKMRAVGANPKASDYAGIPVERTCLTSMMISGALAGLAGGIEVMSGQHRLWDTLLKGYGFEGITVALVGQLHPFGVFVSAIFFGALRAGANAMQVIARVPTTIIYIIQSFTILFVVGGTAYRMRPRYKEKQMPDMNPHQVEGGKQVEEAISQ